jgi:hypothetical protein
MHSFFLFMIVSTSVLVPPSAVQMSDEHKHTGAKRYASTEKGKAWKEAKAGTEGQGLPLSPMSALLSALEGSVYDVKDWTSKSHWGTNEEKERVFKSLCPTRSGIEKALHRARQLCVRKIKETGRMRTGNLMHDTRLSSIPACI